MRSSLRAVLVAAVRKLLTDVPQYDATRRERANYQLYKAEVFDLLAGHDPFGAPQLREIADQARIQARIIAREF